MHQLFEQIPSLMQNQNFDTLAVGLVDFKTHEIHSYLYHDKRGILEQNLFFDLASMTKPLTMGAAFIKHNELRTKEIQLLIEHRAGLPAWSILSRDNWKEHIEAFPIKESKTEYSDLSALRVKIEMEMIAKKDIKELCHYYWDSELMHWMDLDGQNCVETGFRRGHVIKGEVHDPNAYNLPTFCSHAGMFGTIEGVCRSLLNLDREVNLLSTMKKNIEHKPADQRYCWGWDTVQNSEDTLAGPGASKMVFGHLGFTGTSMWIDSEKQKGIVILSNATQNYWYQKEGINHIRRTLGTQFWKQN